MVIIRVRVSVRVVQKICLGSGLGLGLGPRLGMEVGEMNTKSGGGDMRRENRKESWRFSSFACS